MDEYSSETYGGFLDLVRRAQAGDRRAMDTVLATLRPQLEQLARAYGDPLRPAQSSTDLLQESCVRAWRHIDKFAAGGNDEETFVMFRAWMSTIVRNLGLNAKRDQAARGRSPPGKVLPLGPKQTKPTTGGGRGALPANTPTPSESVCADEASHRIRAAIDGLPDPLGAEIVRLRFLEGLKFREIAELLSLDLSVVRDRHSTAIRRLRRQMENWK